MPPRMIHPLSFCEFEQNGHVYMADGLRPPRRWDPLRTASEEAGLNPPTTAPTLAGTATGAGTVYIVGTRVAYVRFVDRLGYFSNLSPISAKVDFGAATVKTVTDASNQAPIVITATAHGFSNDDIIEIKGVEGNTAANGVWQIDSVTANTFILKYKVNPNGSINTSGSSKSVGNGSYRGGTGTAARGYKNIAYTNLPTMTDSKVVKRQILRNKPGDMGTFYVDIETTDLTSTALTSSNADEDLTEEVPLLDDQLNDLAISRYTKPPDWMSVVTSHLNFLVAAVPIVYDRGNVLVTNGSFNVLGIGTDFTRAFVGRRLYVTGALRSYEILYVNETTQLLTLTEPYADNSNTYADFAISREFVERNKVYFSMPDEPESWPPTRALDVPLTPVSGQMTALISNQSYLYAISEFQTWRLLMQIDPVTDGTWVPVTRRGCVNHRCWVTIEDTAFMLDGQGIYQTGGADADPITGPVQEVFRFDWMLNLNPNWKINFQASEYFHCCHSPAEETIRWFVAFSGAYTPRHAICYHYRTKQVWIEEYYQHVGASVLGTLGRGPTLGTRQMVFLGTEANTLLALGIGTLDVSRPGYGTLRGTVTSAGPDWLIDGRAGFPIPYWVVGAPVHITAGTGKGQWRRIVEATAQKLTVDQPWMAMPDTTSEYQIGGIAYRWRSGWFKWSAQQRSGDTNVERKIRAIYRPTTEPASMELLRYADQGADPLLPTWDVPVENENGIGAVARQAGMPIDTERSTGLVVLPVPAARDQNVAGHEYVSVELAGVTNVDPAVIHEVEIEGAER